MNYRFFITTVLLIKIPFCCVFGQNGTSDRDEYFRRMELRAIELSRKMAELAGEEPVQIIQPRAVESLELQNPKAETTIVNIVEPVQVSVPSVKPNSSVQESYDALPGPSESNQTSNPKQYEDKVGEGSIFSQSTTEELKGVYFLKPSFVFQAPFDSQVKSVNKLAGKVGNGIGVVVGRRIENWTLLARFGHTHQDFSNTDFMPGTNPKISAAGDVETLSLTGNIGISVPLNEKLSFEACFGLGYTSVSHSLEMSSANFKSSDVLSDSGFSYELSLLLDYSFSETLSVFLGYRLTGIPENNGSQVVQFDSVNAHLFELGLGLNF